MIQNLCYIALLVACILVPYLTYRYLRGSSKKQISPPVVEAITNREQVIAAYREEVAEKKSSDVARQLEVERQQAIDLQEYQATNALCEEKGVNIFDWLAAQTQADRIRFAACVSADDIHRYWLSKSTLPLWTDSSSAGVHLVRADSCNSPEEWDDIYGLVGKIWFDSDAISQYVYSAQNMVTLFRRGQELNRAFSYLDILNELTNELAATESLSYIDAVEKVIESAADMQSSLDFPSHRQRRYDRMADLMEKPMMAAVAAKTRIIEAKCQCVDFLDNAIALAKIAVGIHWAYADSDREIGNQKRIALTGLAISKALEFCVTPFDVARLKSSLFYNVGRGVRNEHIDAWFQVRIDACATIDMLSAFCATFNDCQREEYAEMANRRSVQIKLS